MDTTNQKIIVPRARFLISAPDYVKLPAAQADEYCLLGRSNVGKSSFLNHLFAEKSLARVSGKPGKTVMINLYGVGSGEVWADLPGYGYAKAAKSEQGRMSALLGDYCGRREGLRGIIWLLDVRHPGTTADLETGRWLLDRQLPVLPVLTKCDKVSRGEAAQAIDKYVQLLKISRPVVTYSTMNQNCRELFWQTYCDWRSRGNVQ